MSEHAPLPYRTTSVKDTKVVCINDTRGDAAALMLGVSTAQRAATAELIVRCCNSHEELLAACQYLCAEIHNRCSQDELERVARRVEAVIAKAEGES